ncbi:MAG: hypothetical protein WAX77_12330 [Methylococcaceae bacterium]
MFELIKLLFAICLWRKSPEDVPYSINLWRLLILSDISISFLVLNIRGDWLSALMQAIFGTILISLFAWFSLLLAQKQARFYQTSSALLGTDTLISFCALPAIATFTLGQGGLLVLIFMTGIIIWQWLVIAHIIRAALMQSLSFSLSVAFLYLLSAYSLTALLFPEVAGLNN